MCQWRSCVAPSLRSLFPHVVAKEAAATAAIAANGGKSPSHSMTGRWFDFCEPHAKLKRLMETPTAEQPGVTVESMCLLVRTAYFFAHRLGRLRAITCFSLAMVRWRRGSVAVHPATLACCREI